MSALRGVGTEFVLEVREGFLGGSAGVACEPGEVVFACEEVAADVVDEGAVHADQCGSGDRGPGVVGACSRLVGDQVGERGGVAGEDRCSRASSAGLSVIICEISRSRVALFLSRAARSPRGLPTKVAKASKTL